MPIYEYECMQCGKIDEVIQKFHEKPLKKCNHCSGKLQKLISHSSFHLKGTGWYVTDYAGKSGSPPTTQETSAKASSTDTSKSESSTSSTDTSKSNSSETKTEKSADKTS
ncbi:MAG: zinc ribbon domain-containing protein [Desulfobacterales bacterium]|uniref:Zinc ribbon domain-containing protein n=1 Tax=Candidatus Desulfatibia vada TaxID=2841696 RepID=A0A8J6P5H4_9BACT|nr:zinc ribbon domain-containing protein [Candidatus Desulfatibia vada]MBL6972354.1 zinc ribbon domain-containing protein [Desulfobacterales bacterium]